MNNILKILHKILNSKYSTITVHNEGHYEYEDRYTKVEYRIYFYGFSLRLLFSHSIIQSMSSFLTWNLYSPICFQFHHFHPNRHFYMYVQ